MARRYDSRTTIFSPEGRLYQIEYAMEAISHAGTVLGVLAKDGVVLAAEKKVTGKLLDLSYSKDGGYGGSGEKIYLLNSNVIGGVAGLTADANSLINYSRSAAQQHLLSYNEDIPVELLVQRLCDLKQGYTQYGGYDSQHRFQLYHSDPSGNYSGWKATCIGANNGTAQSLLKQEYKDDIEIKAAISLVLKTMSKTMDSTTLGSEKLEFAVLTLDPETKEPKAKIYRPDEIDQLLQSEGLAKKDEDTAMKTYPLDTVFSPLFPTLFDDGFYPNTLEISQHPLATSAQAPVHNSPANPLSALVGHTTATSAHTIASSHISTQLSVTIGTTHAQSSSSVAFYIAPSSISFSTTSSVSSASATSTPTKALSFAPGDSKQWKIVGIAVISVASVIAVILLAMFFDSWWAFVRDVVFKSRKRKREFNEDLVPDWDRQSWQVKVASEDGHRYPVSTQCGLSKTEVYAGALRDEDGSDGHGIVPSLPPRLEIASPEVHGPTPYCPQPLYRQPSTRSQYAERYPQMPGYTHY
ncbi:Proteasome subunit alpha type-3 [Paramarasmius palmivorus]|uniref:Proteasome subunit alpha type-3 n=1 Tax=Paramarasmius palmivorus TaxID=297713 RepID=A0AAW0DNQ1_9AGAR